MSYYHVYSIPPELLDSLSPRSLLNSQHPDQPPKDPSPENNVPTTSSGPRSCNTCPEISFASLDEQRAHFRSDWHRYNVKTRLAGGNAVTEPSFSHLIEALEDSISGSESSSEEESSSEPDAVDTLVRKTKRLARTPSPDSSVLTGPQTALTWFHSPPSTQIGIYKALCPHPKKATTYLSQLRDMQSIQEGGRTWAMFMVAGGHFAGAIVRVSRPAQDEDQATAAQRKNVQKIKPDIEVLRHKTFHRYTTRRKQGGSQSMNDNAKGPAKSAGALLRRYGEQSLRDDIRNLLVDWEDNIRDCERIWIRASGSNRKIFIGYDGALISKDDERLRTFPFPTRRPTQSELSRCILELTRVKITHFTEDELKEQDEAYLTSLPKPKTKPIVPATEPEKPKVIKLSKEEEVMREKWSRLLEMVSKGRLDPLRAFWAREAPNIGTIDVQIPEWTNERRATLLQVAAQSGHEDLTHWLLEEARADPTIPVPIQKFDDLIEGKDGEEEEHQSDTFDAPQATKGLQRTAYDLARRKGVRDVFRRCAAAHPDWWDWFGAARVPSALSKEMEQEQEEKKKVRKKGLKERVREREAREREKEEPSPLEHEKMSQPQLMSQTMSTTNRLGGKSGVSEGVAGLTPEMQAKVERERRARAAEARLKTLGR